MAKKVVTQLDEARMHHAESIETMEEFLGRIQQLPEDVKADELEFCQNGFERAKAAAARWADQVDKLEAIAEAHRAYRPDPTEDNEEDRGKGERGDGTSRPATPR